VAVGRSPCSPESRHTRRKPSGNCNLRRSLERPGEARFEFQTITFKIIAHEQLIASSAAGLIPLAIGIGFLFDYNMQRRELSHFGLIDADKA
jgi:hypothetical protein